MQDNNDTTNTKIENIQEKDQTPNIPVNSKGST